MYSNYIMSLIQSIIFNKQYWTIPESQKWLYDNNLKLLKGKMIDITKNFYRFRIKDPKQFKYFRTKKLNNHIDLVLGFY